MGVNTHKISNKNIPHTSFCLVVAPSQNWTTIIPMTEARPGYHDTCHNFLQAMPATSATRFTHIRFNIFPDGGVARLRVFGSAVPDWSTVSHSQVQIFLVLYCIDDFCHTLQFPHASQEVLKYTVLFEHIFASTVLFTTILFLFCTVPNH